MELRERLRTISTSTWMWVMTLGFVLLALFLFRDYGITWDETVEHFVYRKGERTFTFWFGGFDPVDALFETGHNPFTFFAYYTLHHGLDAFGLAPEIHESYHLFTVLIAALGFVLVYRLAGRFMPDAWALAAVLFLLLSPRYFGNCFTNFKDIPFAVCWVFCIQTLLRATREPTTSKMLLHGVGLGLLMTVRIGGLMFVPISLLGLFLGARASSTAQWRARILGFSAAMAVAMAIHYLSYPYVLLHPIDGFWELLTFQSQFPWPGDTLTLGQAIRSDAVPMWYVPIWLLVSTPEVLLVGWLIALFFGATRGRLPGLDARIVLFALLFPLAYVILTAAPIYDGLRHILFLFPLWVIIAFWGFYQLHTKLRWRRAVPSVLAVTAIWLAIQIAQLHPYQTVYFNQLVGGSAGAQGKFTLDYWANISKESALWLKDEIGPVGRLCVTAELSPSWEVYLPTWVVADTLSIKDCPSWSQYAYAFARNDWLDLATEYADAHPTLWVPIHHIERSGARLGTVFKNLQPTQGP